jgi:hypothetical protein
MADSTTATCAAAPPRRSGHEISAAVVVGLAASRGWKRR